MAHVGYTERADSAGQIQDMEQRLREYEDALDELVRVECVPIDRMCCL